MSTFASVLGFFYLNVHFLYQHRSFKRFATVVFIIFAEKMFEHDKCFQREVRSHTCSDELLFLFFFCYVIHLTPMRLQNNHISSSAWCAESSAETCAALQWLQSHSPLTECGRKAVVSSRSNKGQTNSCSLRGDLVTTPSAWKKFLKIT